MRLIGIVLGLGLILAPLAAESQQTGKVHRIGLLTLISDPAYEEVFRQSLKERGYEEGKNVVLDGGGQKVGPNGLRILPPT